MSGHGLDRVPVLTAAHGKVRRLSTETRRAVRAGGLRAATAVVLSKLWLAGIRAGAYVGEFMVDQRYGMKTRGIRRNEETLRGSAEHPDSHHYQAISTRGFRSVLSAAGVDPRATAFVDLGAGRGRAVVLAAHHGFTRILGVELDPALVEQARMNVARWRRRRRPPAPVEIDIQWVDAARVDLPDEPLLVFLYNSFGPTTLRAVLDRLVSSHERNPRPITLCYFNPVHAEVADRYEALTVSAQGRGWTVYAVR